MNSGDGRIGSSFLRLEDPPLLRGEGRFVDDIRFPGLLQVTFLRSPHPHARIVSIDTAAARAMPGVHAVLTLADLLPVLHRGNARMVREPGAGGKIRENMWAHVLQDKEVAYVGEPIAMVVAETRYLAEDAAQAIDVEYDALPAVADCREAAVSQAKLVRGDLTTNVINTLKVGYGDVDGAFKNAAHVFKDTLWQHRGSGHSIETRGVVADYQAANGGVTVWASTQKAHDLQQQLHALVKIDENALRVVAPNIGGGFGPKLCVYSEDVAVVAAAALLKRSLKWIEDRREYFLCAVQERDQYWSVEAAADKDGKILGLRGKLIHDQGAYALQDVNLPYNSASGLPGPYVVPALHMDVVIVNTNKTPVSSVRGAGYPQASFAIERLLDGLARDMGLDRAEIRLRNFVQPEQMPYETPLKSRAGSAVMYDSGDFPRVLKDSIKLAEWADFPRRQKEARAKGRHIGIGIANGIKGTGRGPFEMALVRVTPSGKISVYTGAAAIGQGLVTAMAQIAAAELGVHPGAISVVPGDTAFVPLGLGAFASRQTVNAGNSVKMAAAKVAEKARAFAGMLLQADPATLELADGLVRVKNEPGRAIALADLARNLRGGPGYPFPDGMEPGLEATASFRTDFLAYANATHVVEVEVDVETGSVHLLRYVATHDTGNHINPLIVNGQVTGSIVHGIGNALFEWMGYDADAQPVTTSFAEYLLVTATEIPHLEIGFRHSPSPLNPLGVKGVGEIGVAPVASAIMSAIENALDDRVRISQTPLMPPQLLELIHNNEH